MKVKNGFILRQVAGQNVVLPVDADLNLNMMITLNETGAFLWENLQEETDAETAAVDGFLAKLHAHEFLV